MMMRQANPSGSIVKRSVVIAGHQTSVSLESLFPAFLLHHSTVFGKRLLHRLLV